MDHASSGSKAEYLDKKLWKLFKVHNFRTNFILAMKIITEKQNAHGS